MSGYGLIDTAVGPRGKAAREAPGAANPQGEFGGDPDLRKLIAYTEEAIQGTQEENALSLRDFDYYHSKQWTAKEREALALRRQPCITDNQIKEKINILAGLELKARADPAAWPRTPMDEENADAATKALRFVKDDNNYDIIRSQTYLNMLIGGCAAVEVTVENIPDNGEGDDGGYGDNDRMIKRNPKVKYAGIAWDRFLRDPRSCQPDFCDSKYIGTIVWSDFEDAVDMFPHAENLLAYEIARSSMGYRTYDDRPDSMTWLDPGRKRVRFVQMNYRKNGIWHLATFTRGGWLSEPQVSPYVDREGRPARQFFAASAYVDTENRRYGYVRDLVDKQDEINKRRSKMQHLLNVRQVQMQKGAVADEDILRKELARPDGLIITNQGFEFKIIETGDLAQGQLQLLEQIQARMVASGPNASMAGKDDRDLSGKAIIAQQAGGSLELAPIADRLRQLDKEVYEATWLRIRQFWNAPQWIRVTKDGEDTKWVGLNRKVTLGDALAEQPDNVRQQYMQQMNITDPSDPRLDDVITTINDVGNMDLDITVDDAPEFPTIAAEQFQQLTDLAGGGVPIPPEVLIAASSLRDKKDLLDKLKESQQAGAQAQQAQQQAAAAAQAADVQKTQAETGEIQARTQKVGADAAASGAKAQNTQANTVLTNAEALFASHRARQAMVESYAAAAALPLIDQARRAQESVLPGVH